MISAIGWTASAILLATLIRQIIKQAYNPGEEGVSSWLFIGQAAASALFIIYSLLLDNWVFTVTNSLILATAVTGQWIGRHKHKARKNSDRENSELHP